MAYSYIYTEVTGTDSTETIPASSVTFPYIRKSHVEVYISGAADSLPTFKTNLAADSITALVQGTDYNIADSGDITFVTSTLTLSNVHQIQVKRNSDLSTNYVNFLDGSVVTEGNLDDAQKQQLYLSQELADAKVALLEDGSLESGAMSFSGLADTTIATPTSGQVPVYDGSDSWDNKTHSVALTGDVTGTANMDNTGAVSIAATIQDGAVQFDDLDAAAVVVASEGITATDVAVPTSQAVKEYVDTQLTAEDLDVTSDSGTIAIDLDSATLTVAGGTGIDTSATGTTVTAAIDSTVATLDDTQTLTNKTLTTPTLTSPAINTGVSGSAIDTDLNAVSSSDDTLASAKAIKTYVDAQVDTEDTFAELNDTNIATPTEGQIPVYDGSDSWDNKTHSVALTGDVTGTANMAATGAVSVDTTLINGLKNVVEDTTPQLGGSLDTAGNSIVNDTTDGDVTIAPDGTGQVVLANTEVLLDEVSAPGTPGANKGALYAKDDSGTTKLYFKDPAGVETGLLEGGDAVTGVTLIADDTNTASDSSGNVDMTIAGGDGITTTANNGATLTVTHNDTSTQASVNNSGQDFIQDITLDAFGHITEITSSTALGGGGTVDTSGTPITNDFAKFTDVDTIEGRSYSETVSDLTAEIHSAIGSSYANTTPAGWNSDITNATGLYGLTLDAGDAPDSTYGLKLKNGSDGSGFVDFYEDSDNGTNKCTLKSPDDIPADCVVTLPDGTGTLLSTTTNVPMSQASGTLAVSKGGTGRTSYTAGDLLYASDAYTLESLAKGGASQVLAMNSGATAPEWVDASSGDITEVAAGTGIAVAGGTSGTATVSMDDPANGTSIDEGEIATDDRMPIWDESVSEWRYVTIDNLQDEIDTGGGGGEANQNAWSTITVPTGTTSQAADTATDTIAFTAAGGMTITGGGDDTIEFSSANTTYTGGTNLTLVGTAFNVDDAFLKNDADDTTTGTVTAAGFTTTGTLTLDSVGLSTVQTSGESFADNDTSVMTSAAVADKIEAYGYSTSGISAIEDDTTPQLGGTLDTNGKQIRWSKGADIGSATALTVGTDGNYFDVTGTTTITSINTLAAGTLIKLHFDASLTLTHHATDLVLPGGINITTAAGDEAEFIEYDAGDWRCTFYTRADGTPVNPIAEIGIACSDEATDSQLQVTTDLVSFLIPRAMRLSKVKASLVYADNTADLDVLVKYHVDDPNSAVNILNATSSCQIATTEYFGETAASGSFASAADSYDLANNSFVVISLDAAASDAYGLKVWLLGHWA